MRVPRGMPVPSMAPMWKRMKELRAMVGVQPIRNMQQRFSSVKSRRTTASTKRSISAARASFQKDDAALAFEGSTELDEYELLTVLGRGTFGIVKLARHRESGRGVAIKILSKDRIQQMKQEKNIMREQTVHLLLDHPFVSRLYATFQDKDALYFVVEYCPGGEIYSLVYTGEQEEDVDEDEDTEEDDGGNQAKNDASSEREDDRTVTTDSESEEDDQQRQHKKEQHRRSSQQLQRQILTMANFRAKQALRSSFGGLHERHVAFYLGCLVTGLEYLHEMNILYRDLKLENLVLDVDGYPKLIDFGLSKPDAAMNDRNTTMCGSMEYMAPEVLQRQPYDLRADMWSFGIIMYELLFGTTPFYHSNHREQGRRITMEPVPFPNNFEEEFPSACELINMLLSKNPAERPTSFKQIRQSSFFTKYFPNAQAWQKLGARQLPAPFVPVLDGAFDTSLFVKTVGDEDAEEFDYTY